MKLKNFIEVTNPIPGGENYMVNINHITCFKHNRIYGLDCMELCIVETSEQIQQKIFDCQNLDLLKITRSETTPIINPAHIEVTKKEFRDYLNK